MQPSFFVHNIFCTNLYIYFHTKIFICNAQTVIFITFFIEGTYFWMLFSSFSTSLVLSFFFLSWVTCYFSECDLWFFHTFVNFFIPIPFPKWDSSGMPTTMLVNHFPIHGSDDFEVFTIRLIPFFLWTLLYFADILASPSA